ncbi:HTH-type transcriptional repressor RghR [Caloramator mitchellensis]|uniref:HTH-type transcriptional repressor RghR n=1 Tax=Caloramator mitchellensis TaxID=908809 RepID=A0A0R3JXT7_CALMK|nr:helix-turn-helix domain-containing protein [Caloramator mitchellensis]KRQ86014.1 HTH-type transcriptional repressor RghR [Caloramator mitchellensis]
MIYKKENEAFGDYVVRLRQSKGYSQRKLAQITGLSNTTISRIESGVTEKPDADTIKILARCLNVDEEYMFRAAGYIEKDYTEKTESSTLQLTAKEEKDIAKRLEKMKEDLLKQQGLMFNGEPASPEAIESILAALEFGMRQAKIINKKYTPKKYRKDNE